MVFLPTMFKSTPLIVLLAAILWLSWAGCSKYQKILKSSDYNLKFKKAKEYLDKKDYVRALPLYEELMTVFRGTSKMEECLFYFAYCNYGIEDYVLASYHFKNFYKSFPKSDKAEEAMFLNAYCFYLDSPRFSLDQTSTIDAINEFQLFVTMFPVSTRIGECNEIIDKLRLKLQVKAFETAKMYFHMEDYKASVASFKNLIKEFPESKFREEAQFLMLKSQYLLAKNSIEAKQAERYEEAIKFYYTFVDAFTGSKWSKDAETIFENCRRNLKAKT
jgi:outer membrane protein assembly factor BamD